MNSSKTLSRQNIVFNTLFILYWISAAAFFMLFYGSNTQTGTNTYISVYLIICFICVDIHHRFITEPNIKVKRYLRFILLSAFLFIAAFWLETFTSFILHFYFLDIKEGNAIHGNLSFRNQIGGVNMIVFGGIALRFMNESFKLNKQNEKKDRIFIESQLQLKEMELEQLKGQINPHFLFNSLNCIYGLSLEKSEQTPDVILRLSSILDYILYKCKDCVLLSEELKQLENYTYIQKERFGKLLNLTLSLEINNDRRIAPLLLFTLVENAFKHAKPDDSDRIVINIKIKSAITLDLEINNSIDQNSGTETKGGIGLKNLKRRLVLLYPNSHEIITKECDIYYNTVLRLNFNENDE